MHTEIFYILGAVILLALGFRLFAGALDGQRIRDYVRQQGGELLEKHWSPFGRGWLGEKNARIYKVRFRDSSGNIHQATVKTSMFSGVYFTEDRVVSYGQKPQPPRSNYDLMAENQKLRERVEQLERKRS